MKEEFAKMIAPLKDDHIYLHHGYIRALSFLWWAVRVAQVALFGIALWFAYCGLWTLIG